MHRRPTQHNQEQENRQNRQQGQERHDELTLYKLARTGLRLIGGTSLARRSTHRLADKIMVGQYAEGKIEPYRPGRK